MNVADTFVYSKYNYWTKYSCVPEMGDSLSMLRLHRGQVCCRSSQGSTQSLWNSWRHGNTRRHCNTHADELTHRVISHACNTYMPTLIQEEYYIEWFMHGCDPYHIKSINVGKLKLCGGGI